MNGWMRIRVMSAPCAQPSSMGIAMAAPAAKGHGQCHSRSDIASSTPHNANMDPTDKSIPPVIITSPRPILKMPNRPMTLAILPRLTGEMNFGFRMAVTRHKTSNKTEMPISFFTQNRFEFMEASMKDGERPSSGAASCG